MAEEPSKIRHSRTGMDQPLSTPDDSTAEPVSMAAEPIGSPKKEIRAFGPQKRHEDAWDRTPNTTGTGAIHVKSFHSKLTDDALRYMDQQVNEWLDLHPQYEVKFVNANIGTFTGKIKEPHLILQVWV